MLKDKKERLLQKQEKTVCAPGSPNIHITVFTKESTHQFSVLLTEACELFLWGAECVQSLHEESDLFTCMNKENRERTESELVFASVESNMYYTVWTTLLLT